MNNKGISAKEMADALAINSVDFGLCFRVAAEMVGEVVKLNNLKMQLQLLIGDDMAQEFIDKIWNEAIQQVGRNYDYMVSKLEEKINAVMSGQ